MFCFCRYLFFYDKRAITDPYVPSIKICVSKCINEFIYEGQESRFFEIEKEQGIQLCRYDIEESDVIATVTNATPTAATTTTTAAAAIYVRKKGSIQNGKGLWLGRSRKYFFTFFIYLARYEKYIQLPT